MPTIDEVRQQFPQYGDLSDTKLADAIHQKFYSDMPRDQFDQQIGLGDPVQANAARNRSNLATSAVNAASNIVQPILHPLETAENIGKIGKGVLQKVGIMSGDDATKYADAVGHFFSERYGGWDNIKKTLDDDPVGSLMDVSAVLTAGGGAAARVPGVVGEVGNAVKTAGALTDPVRAAGALAAPVVEGAGNVAAQIGGLTTGAGPEAIKTAARAGLAGGEAGKAFREGLAGSDTAQSTVAEAKAAVNQLRAERGVAYREAMDQLKRSDSALGPENQVLDFNKIDAAVDKVASVKNYKGQDLSPATKDVRAEITSTIDEWKKLPPADFHTVEGLDALKQKLGDIRDGTQPNTPARLIADQTYHAVRNTITDQAPEYAKIMKGYEQASSLIKEIEKTLSLNPKASIDTSLRKLQSVLRDNVNTNYGRRAELVDFLTRAGAPHLMDRLSGQMLSSASPRGLSRVGAIGEGAGALTAAASGHIVPAAILGAATLASSPALVGGIAHGLGSVGRLPGRTIGQSAFQLGRQPLSQP